MLHYFGILRCVNAGIFSSTFSPARSDRTSSVQTKPAPKPLRRAPRIHYSTAQKSHAIAVFRECVQDSGDESGRGCKELAIRKLIEQGWDPLRTNRQMLDRFLKSNTQKPKTMGRPVNDRFEQEVKAQLMYTVFDPDNPEQSMTISAAYTRANVVNIARQIAQWPAFAKDPAVQRLQFGAMWFANWKRRNGLTRRRATATKCTAPNMQEALQAMHSITKRLQKGSFSPNQIVNADETADYFCQTSKYVYVPVGETRAAVPNMDNSNRVTAHLSVTGGGEMLPAFIILRNSVNKPDSSKSRISHSAAMKVSAAMIDEGGTMEPPKLLQWCKTIRVSRKGTVILERYVIPYAVLPDGTIITANYKAWMNTAYAVMWIELVLKPERERRGKLALIWDNCGAHKSEAVIQALDDANVDVFLLPPNTTDRFQVCDVVVNGMLKAKLRSLRSVYMVDSFRDWKAAYEVQLAEYFDAINTTKKGHVHADGAQTSTTKSLAPPVLWSPPPLTIVEGLLTMMKALQILKTPSKRDALSRAFVRLGLSPSNEGKWFLTTATGRTGALADDADFDIADALGVPSLAILNDPWTSDDEECSIDAERRAMGAAADVSANVPMLQQQEHGQELSELCQGADAASQ